MTSPPVPPVVLIGPDGKRCQVWNVRAFARAHRLDSGNLHRVIAGERQHHKGWRLAGEEKYFTRKPYAIERYLEARQ